MMILQPFHSLFIMRRYSHEEKKKTKTVRAGCEISPFFTSVHTHTSSILLNTHWHNKKEQTLSGGTHLYSQPREAEAGQEAKVILGYSVRSCLKVRDRYVDIEGFQKPVQNEKRQLS